MMLLIGVLIYYLSILCKHIFYFQARVEQSIPFLHLSSFSSYYGARPKTSRTGSLGNSRINALARYPKNTRHAYTPGTSRTNPSPSYPRCLGPRLNLDSKPPLLSPRLRVVQGPPSSSPPISRSRKSWIYNKRATRLPCAHTQVCAQDNKSMTFLEPYAMIGP